MTDKHEYVTLEPNGYPVIDDGHVCSDKDVLTAIAVLAQFLTRDLGDGITVGGVTVIDPDTGAESTVGRFFDGVCNPVLMLLSHPTDITPVDMSKFDNKR